MESPIPVTNPTDDHLINKLSLYLQQYHKPVMSHMEIPIGNTKNPIEIIPISIMIPMMVRTLFLAVMAFIVWC